MTPAALSVVALRRIEAVCTRFENAPPDSRDVEAWLGESTGQERDCLRQELIALNEELSGNSSSEPADAETSKPESHRYRFIEPIGQGGIGTVWRVLDTKTARPLAIKLLNGSLRHHPTALARLRREAQLTGALQHPGVPPVHDHDFLSDGRAFFSMKLVEGVTLAEQLSQASKHRDGVSEVLGIFEQVAQVLAYAHANGVIHRDVKPNNIMVGKFGEVQLMDWGMAKRINENSPRTAGNESLDIHASAVVRPASDETTCRRDQPLWLETEQERLHQWEAPLTIAGDIMGTPAYMSPEQARGEVGSVDSRSDVFALGAILYEILVGSRLYNAKDSRQVLLQAAAADHAEALMRLDQVVGDEPLKTLCRSCVQLDPTLRPKDAGVVADAVAAHLFSVQQQLRLAEAERQAAVFRVLAESKQRKILAVMSMLVVLVLSFGFVAVAWQWNHSVAANRRTIEALALADQRFKQAQQVVDDYLSDVAESDSVLAKTPGAEPIRRQLLEKAKDYYEQFLAEANNDPKIAHAAANANQRLGRIEQVLFPGSEQAVELYRRAIALFEQAKPLDAANQRITRDIADVHVEIGKVHLSVERFAEASESFIQAMELLEKLVNGSGANKDDNPGDILALAKATHNLALCKDKQGQTSQSQRLFAEAIALTQPLLESNPDDSQLLMSAGNMYSNAGMQYGFKLRDWESSLQYTRRSLKLREHLVAVHPGDHRFEDALAVSHNNIGLALYQAKDYELSKKSFETAARIREKLILEHPSIPQYAKQLSKTYSNLGTFSVKQGMPQEAIANYERSIELNLMHMSNHPQVLDHGRSAIDALISIAAIDPESPRAEAAIRQTVEIYKQMLDERPDSLAFSVNWALYASLLPETDGEALVRFTDAITLQNTSVTPRHRTIRALALCQAGLPQRSLEHLELIAPTKRDCLSWSVMAIAQYHLDDLESSQASARKAREKLQKPYPDYCDWFWLDHAEELLGETINHEFPAK